MRGKYVVRIVVPSRDWNRVADIVNEIERAKGTSWFSRRENLSLNTGQT